MNGTDSAKLQILVRRVLLILLMVSAVLWHAKLSVRLDFDGENSRTEAESLYGLRAAQTGQTLYHDFAQPPHILTQYMPLFYFVPATVARLLHTDQLGTFVVGRCYVYGLWLGIAGMIYVLVRAAGGKPVGATLAAILWLASGLAPQWANSYRPDSAALFFSLAAVWAYRRRPFLAAILLAVAALHKQSAVVPLAVIVWDECRQRHFRQAGMITAVWAVGVGVVTLIGGGVLVKNVFGSLPRTHLAAAPWYAALALVRGAPIFIGATLSRPRGLWRDYFVAALAFAAISVTKAGANVNYFLEPFAVGCVLTGVWMSQTGGWWRLGWLGLTLASILLGLTQAVTGVATWKTEWVDHRAIRAREAKAWDVVLGGLQELPDPVLIEDPYLACRVGRSPFILNVGNFGAMNGRGGFDEAVLLQRLETGEITAVIASEPMEAGHDDRPLPARWCEVIGPRYALTARPAPGVFVYRYRPINDD